MSAGRGEFWAPGKLWSLWDMLELKAASFMHLMQVMSHTEQMVETTSGDLPPEVIGVCGSWANTINLLSAEMGLTAAQRASEYVRRARTSEDLIFAFRHVRSSILSELQDQIFYAPRSDAQRYFKQTKLFGDAVWTAFPSAFDDIYEAGMCLALDRYTACVMHLMRATEVGLRALGTSLGTGLKHDWGSYLREIDRALKDRLAASGARGPEEQFFAEIAAQIDNVRRAYRNPTMHADRVYGLEQAEDLFASTRSLMQLLSTRLREPAEGED